MTQAFLQSELTSLISDSKRKNNEVRTASEQSLADLRAISVTSETQLAGDLLRRPRFIDPFILACKSKNVKLVSNGTVCLQRLTASRAVARSRLPDLLEAFADGLSAGYEPQLKILQTLPSLLQLYAADIHGDLLARILEICVALQASKTAIVSNTAAATFQQLINSVFEQVGKVQHAHISSKNESQDPGDRTENEDRGPDDDAVRLFNDFCLLLNHQAPSFTKFETLPADFLLETLQTILSSYSSILVAHPEQSQICRDHLLPGLSKQLARRDSFGTLVRAVSILTILVQTSADLFQEQLQEILSSLINALEKDGNLPWKRVLYLEFFRDICSDFGSLRKLFDLFDSKGNSGGVIGQLMASFVRIAAEDPSLIGLGRQSTIPIFRGNDLRGDEVASIEAQGLGGAITSVSSADSSTTGLSTDWSIMSTPLLRQPERHAPPAIPSTYLYTLVLESTASFCDGLSKFVMPLSVPSRSTRLESGEETRRNSTALETAEDETLRKSSKTSTSSHKYQRLVNPLSLSRHPSFPHIQLCARMIEACWPAALATCSTFLNSALDSEFYHILIRSVQKLAQVSGVLELSTPRDALLTTLAKASIPTNASSVIAAYQSSRAAKPTATDDINQQTDDLKSPREPPPTPTLPYSSSPLNVRHLLCLRALLNLGIALGPTLEQGAWLILIETMQQVEALIAIPAIQTASSQTGTPKIGSTGQESQTTLAGEIASVQAATKRMLESTRGYNGTSFTSVVNALFRLLGQNESEGVTQARPELVASPVSSTKLGSFRPTHHASRSVSGLWTKSKTLDMEFGFVLNKISDLSRINLHRFASRSEQESSWDLVTSRLLQLSQDHTVSDSHRIQSASIVDLISMETVKLLDDPRSEAEEANAIRTWCLEALMDQLKAFDSARLGKHDEVEFEVHKRLLDALESMLSHSGESLNDSWPIALDILSLSFNRLERAKLPKASSDLAEMEQENAQILRVGFRSIQLITSDFLSILSVESLAALARLLRAFGTQDYDMNVALTSTTLLWSLASQTLSRIGKIELERSSPISISSADFKSISEISATELLWVITLKELVQLCNDQRADIRNAAIRVVLKMLDASSENLTANAWATTLASGPLHAIKFCLGQTSAQDNNLGEWMSSAAQLTEGLTLIISQNLTVIAEHKSFIDTWTSLMDVFEAILKTSSLSASSLAFSNIHKLLSTLPSLGRIDESLIVPALRLWATHHPAQVQGQDRDSPNQPAFTAHAHTLIEAYKTSPAAVTHYQHEGKDAERLLRMATQSTILLCTHPPYTSDVKTPAPEQNEVIECLSILKTLLHDDIKTYCIHLLHLLRSTLTIENGRVNATKKSAITKAIQRPTFISFASACVNNIRSVALEYAQDGSLLKSIPVREVFDVLSALTGTKYTSLPTDNQAPLWRNATATGIAVLEAVTKHCSKAGEMETPHLSGVAESIIPVTFNILSPGGLPNPATKYKDEVITEDETFDIIYFQRLHAFVVSLFQHELITESSCKRYAITLFNASLLAKPWFYDIPDELEHEPLKGLTDLRAGSVHKPVFPVRQRICYSALEALFDLVQHKRIESGDDDQESGRRNRLSRNAAPYMLLRVVHPLKTFLSDQRLRGLTPPPILQQVELQTILTKFVELRSDGVALREALKSAPNSTRTPQTINQLAAAADDDDGKEHLRVLYPFLLRVTKFWRSLPRLKGEGAWQGDEAGQIIEDALERWILVVGEGWGI